MCKLKHRISKAGDVTLGCWERVRADNGEKHKK